MLSNDIPIQVFTPYDHNLERFQKTRVCPQEKLAIEDRDDIQMGDMFYRDERRQGVDVMLTPFIRQNDCAPRR